MNLPALILLGTIALSLVISFPMMSLAQDQPSTGKQSQEQFDVPLNFSLKVKGGGDKNASSTEGGKDVTVTLSVQNGQGGSLALVPLTAKLSNDTNAQDLELCTTLQGAEESCQSLEDVVQAQGENQTSDESSNETSTSGDSNDEENDNEDN